MGIDPIVALKPYINRIPHAQAKDVELFPEKRHRFGWPGKAVIRPDPWDVGWWRYRVPGRRQVDWAGLVDAFYEGGFDGVLSVEHRTPSGAVSPAASKPGCASLTRPSAP